MDVQELRKRAHDLDVTVWVGKGGVDAVVDELADQLEAHDLVKVRFLTGGGPDASTDEQAAALADRVGATLVETRGHTAVFH